MGHKSRNKNNLGIPPARPTREQIITLREALGVTPRVMAELIHIAPATYERYEREDDFFMPAASWELLLLKAKLVFKVELPPKMEAYITANYEAFRV